MSPLLYPWEGQEQTQTIQILVLCFINDWLNCLSPWINQNTMPGKQTSVKLLSILQAPEFWPTLHLSQQTALQSIDRPQANHSLIHSPVRLPLHPLPETVLSRLPCLHLSTKANPFTSLARGLQLSWSDWAPNSYCAPGPTAPVHPHPQTPQWSFHTKPPLVKWGLFFIWQYLQEMLS